MYYGVREFFFLTLFIPCPACSSIPGNMSSLLLIRFIFARSPVTVLRLVNLVFQVFFCRSPSQHNLWDGICLRLKHTAQPSQSLEVLAFVFVQFQGCNTSWPSQASLVECLNPYHIKFGFQQAFRNHAFGWTSHR